MKIYNLINDLVNELENKKYLNLNEVNILKNIRDLNSYEEDAFNKELIPLLELLEKVNPCNQQYELTNNNIIISYILKINLFNFRNIFPLRIKVQVIGLPISMSEKGYFGDPLQ